MKKLESIKKKYKVIYADPPWYFKGYSKKGEDRNATKHYPCMEFNDICNLPINNISDMDCCLFLWITDPFLEKSFKLIKKWGFKYKTVAFTWAKKNKTNDNFFMGLGYWTRANPEICLLATKGKPKRFFKNVKQLIINPRQEHSKKPDAVRNNIVNLCGDVPRIELFARQKSEGWDAWGNEVES